MLKRFILSNNNIARNSYTWNLAASLLFGFQSVIILMVLTRTAGLADAGIFTIAYANASLFLFIGKYGVRNYQVSDVNIQHSFRDYYRQRLIAIFLMIASTAVFIIYAKCVSHYSDYKLIIVFLTCIYKVPDAFEDVYFGEYQRQGRLDIAAKIMTLRLLASIVSLIAALIVTRNLMLSLVISIVISFIGDYVMIHWSAGRFDLGGTITKKSIWLIFLNCFPLFAGAFLSQFINNTPKYAIDALLSDELQACYGFIAMPVFVIGLLNNVVFSPVIHTMAEYWNEKKYKAFIKRTIIQMGVVLVITAAAIAGAWVLGTPVLSILYNTDLSAYRTELVVLLIGGGFLAMTGLFNILMTVMRMQQALLFGYAFIAIAASILLPGITGKYGMMGAVWGYTISMIVLAVVFFLLSALTVYRKIRKG